VLHDTIRFILESRSPFTLTKFGCYNICLHHLESESPMSSEALFAKKTITEQIGAIGANIYFPLASQVPVVVR